MAHADGNNNRDQRLWRQYADGAAAAQGACPDPDDLAAWLDGRLDDTEPIETHLADCVACREAVAELREWGTDGKLPMAPPHVLAAARGLVRGPVVEGRWNFQTHLARVAGWSLAAAASIAVCVAGYRVGWSVSGGAAPQLVTHEVTFGLAADETSATAYDLFGFAKGGGVR
jgi:anti-sigma factor RsiW